MKCRACLQLPRRGGDFQFASGLSRMSARQASSCWCSRRRRNSPNCPGAVEHLGGVAPSPGCRAGARGHTPRRSGCGPSLIPSLKRAHFSPGRQGKTVAGEFLAGKMPSARACGDGDRFPGVVAPAPRLELSRANHLHRFAVRIVEQEGGGGEAAGGQPLAERLVQRGHVGVEPSLFGQGRQRVHFGGDLGRGQRRRDAFAADVAEAASSRSPGSGMEA
jgi:hypothetical protein